MLNEAILTYNLKFNKTDEITLKECNKVEKVRGRLFSLGLISSNSDGISFGNISLRYKKKNSFVMTSSKTGEYPKLTPSYYSLVKKIDFKNFTTYAVGPSKPSIDSISHGAIYELDSNINAVIYINNEKIWNYMLQNDYLLMTEDSYNSPQMLKDIKKVYKDIDPFLNNIFAIKNDKGGVLAFGKTLSQAEKSIYEVLKNILKS